MKFSVHTTGAVIGPYLIMTHPKAEGSFGPGETTMLWVIKRDFRDVKANYRWPRLLWPWRRWWIDAWRTRLAYRVGPRRMKEMADFYRAQAAEHMENCPGARDIV